MLTERGVCSANVCDMTGVFFIQWRGGASGPCRPHGDPGPAGVVVLLAGAASPLEVVPDQRVAIPLDQVAGAVVDVGLVFSELCGC